jgi:hypothetical protein
MIFLQKSWANLADQEMEDNAMIEASRKENERNIDEALQE